MNLDTKAILVFYPEAMNYFWRADAILNDYNNKKALILNFEFAIYAFVEGYQKRDRTSTKYS